MLLTKTSKIAGLFLHPFPWTGYIRVLFVDKSKNNEASC